MTETAPQPPSSRPTPKKAGSASRPKEETLQQYKILYGAFLDELAKYEKVYGVPFNPEDPDIPEIFRIYFRLKGMQDTFQLSSDDPASVFQQIHEAIGGEGAPHV